MRCYNYKTQFLKHRDLEEKMGLQIVSVKYQGGELSW